MDAAGASAGEGGCACECEGGRLWVAAAGSCVDLACPAGRPAVVWCAIWLCRMVWQGAVFVLVVRRAGRCLLVAGPAATEVWW